MRMQRRPDGRVADLARLAWPFTRERVPYCAIGGFATATFVEARRPDDLDLVLAPGARSGQLAMRALARLVYDGAADAALIATVADPDRLAAGEGLAVWTRLGKLHIVGSDLPSEVDRAGVVQRRQWALLGQHAVAIPQLADLLALKRISGRPIDLDDAKALSHLGRRR